ncbi:MAG: DUF4330 domain-containing protein [Clostridiales bacterium]|nr:DUF4330 domain-containing protein [Clostridiales bacterium]MBQ3107508.1 DUF4330 domain-containing protein [Bacillota bacterium]
MIIDKKGKLFGKISIIDIFIVLVILAVAVFAIGKFTGNNGITNLQEPAPVEFTLLMEDAPAVLVDGTFEVGDPAIDRTTGAYLGTVSKIVKDPCITETPTADGKIVSAEKPNHYRLYVTVKGSGFVTDSGVTVSNNNFYINRQSDVRFGDTMLYMRMIGYKAIEE